MIDNNYTNLASAADALQPKTKWPASQPEPEPVSSISMTDESRENFNSGNGAGLPGSNDANGLPPQAPAADKICELPSTKPGRFNLEKFRVIDADHVEHAGGRKLLTTIPVRKPSKESWFRAHPDPNYRFPARLIELKEQGEVYLVSSELWSELSSESTCVTKTLVPVMTRQHALLLWPIRLPGADGRIDDWNASAMEAADIARQQWIRLSPNRSLGAYEIIAGPDPQAAVVWPEQSFEALLEIAFKGKIIETLDHPVIRQLRGL
jgi:hypothetical protein